MGRTNKLVDGCYSFWQGGLFPLLQKLMPDYLAQTSIPCMHSASSSLVDSQREGRRDSGVDLAEEAIMRIHGKDPVVQALDDLHRTKV